MSIAPVFAAGDPGDLIQFGVLGIIVMLILLGFLWAKPAVDDLKLRLERAEAQRDSLIETYQDVIIPVLSDANHGTQKALDLVEEVKPVLSEVKVLLLRGGRT